MVKRKWTRESIILKLRDLAESNRDVSLKAIRRDYAGFYQASREFFNDSKEMYEAAGIAKPTLQRMSSRYWTKDRIIKMLRDRHSSGVEISYRAIAREDQRLLGACNSRFGTVYKAASTVHLWVAEEKKVEQQGVVSK